MAAPTYFEQLITARDNIASLIVEITSSPKPNYSLDGESYAWADYLAILLDRQAAILLAIQAAEGPWEINSISR